MDNDDSGAGAQWETSGLCEVAEKLDMRCCPSMGQDVGVAWARQLGY